MILPLNVKNALTIIVQNIFPHTLTGSDFEYNNNSSSNDGLELYVEEDKSDDSDESSEMSLTILCKY